MIEIEIGNRNEIVVTSNGRALGFIRSIQLDLEKGLTAEVTQSTLGGSGPADTVRSLVAHGFEVALVLKDGATVVSKPTSSTQMYCSKCEGYHPAAEGCDE